MRLHPASEHLSSALVVALALLAACGGDGGDGPGPSPGPCTYALNPTALSVAAPGATLPVAVVTPGHCGWTAASDAPWMTLAPASGTGPRSITVTISENTTRSSRSGTLTIGGVAVSVTQQGLAPCAYALNPASQSFGRAGGAGAFDVATEADCRWPIQAGDRWVRVTAPAATAGVGTGRVQFTVEPNTGDSRQTTISVADQAFTVNQDGVAACSYRLQPTEFTLHWHGPGGSVEVSTDTGCPYTSASGADWIQVSTPTAQSGPGRIEFGVGTFVAQATRRAPIEVRWPTVTAGQNVWVTQEGCYIGLSPNLIAAGAPGGSFVVTVLSSPMSSGCSHFIGCLWTAMSEVPWIILTRATGHDGDHLRFDVQPNTGPARTGAVSVEGRLVTVTQEAR